MNFALLNNKCCVYAAFLITIIWPIAKKVSIIIKFEFV